MLYASKELTEKKTVNMKSNIKFIIYFLCLFLGLLMLNGIVDCFLNIIEYDILEYLIRGSTLFLPVSFLIAFVVAKLQTSPSKLVYISTFLVFGILVGLCFIVVLVPEGKFIFYPDIDTYFASGYSNEAFDSITNGMTELQVKKLLQEPLYKSEYGADNHFPGKPDAVWFYTGDGACSWADFAWRSRAVCFRNGVVVGKCTTWCYD